MNKFKKTLLELCNTLWMYREEGEEYIDMGTGAVAFNIKDTSQGEVIARISPLSFRVLSPLREIFFEIEFEHTGEVVGLFSDIKVEGLVLGVNTSGVDADIEEVYLFLTELTERIKKADSEYEIRKREEKRYLKDLIDYFGGE